MGLTVILGGAGLIGSACVRHCQDQGLPFLAPSREECDASRYGSVESFLCDARPERVIVAAGAVGGIIQNLKTPADFLFANSQFVSAALPACQKAGVADVVFFGSSCMYPVDGPQPYKEEAILSGPPEKTSMSYAVSKLLGVQACFAMNAQYPTVRCVPVIPNSTYGPNDDFGGASSHVLSALVGRFHEAKVAGAGVVTIWGSGTPKREFVYSDDVAAAVFHLLDTDTPRDRCVNIGTGEEVTILELARLVATVVGFEGRIELDVSKPDGAPRKLLDSAFLRETGWVPQVGLADGLRKTYDWYLDQKEGVCSKIKPTG